MRIIVYNERVVSEYLGFNVKIFEDLMENSKCKRFIEENMEYLTSVEPKDFIDFFKRTGIVLEHQSKFYKFNFLGLKQEYWYTKEEYKVHTSHLTVIDEENDIYIKDNILYLNGREIRNINNEKKEQDERFNEFERINERLLDIYNNSYGYEKFDIEKGELIEYSNEFFPNYKIIENTKQLVITPYNDIFTLTDDGILYCNNEVYDKNVEYIFEQDIINKIIVYSNNDVEYLTASFGGPLNIRCDKVLYKENCLVTLKNKELRIIYKNYYEYIKNQSNDMTLYGVDDIEFNEYDDDELLVKVGKEEIKIPVF